MKDREVHKDEAYKDDVLSLTHMMDLEPGGPSPWKPEELGPIFEHQLSAPLECDLGYLDKGLAKRLQTVDDPPIRSFADLLGHPHPPLELLELIKRFAKACRNHPDSPLPDEIATVLYCLSIVAAITKCGRRITKMDDQSLRYSLDWALRQPWLDDSSHKLLREGRKALDPSGAE